MDASDITALAMVREWPVRSTITVVVPLLFSVSQLANSYYHGISLVYSGTFATLFIGMTVLILQRQCASFRVSQLQSAEMDEGNKNSSS